MDKFPDPLPGLIALAVTIAAIAFGLGALVVWMVMR